MAKSLLLKERNSDEILSLDDKVIMVVASILITIVILIVIYEVIGNYLANQIYANFMITGAF